MSSRVIGAILILAGIAVVLVTVFAESLGIGVSSGGIEGAPTSPAFGWKQWGRPRSGSRACSRRARGPAPPALGTPSDVATRRWT